MSAIQGFPVFGRPECHIVVRVVAKSNFGGSNMGQSDMGGSILAVEVGLGDSCVTLVAAASSVVVRGVYDVIKIYGWMNSTVVSDLRYCFILTATPTNLNPTKVGESKPLGKR